MFNPKIILDARAVLGESPRWHPVERVLYWVDIAANALHRFDPATENCKSRIFDEPVGCFAFRRGGGFLLAMKNGFAILNYWDAPLIPFGDTPLSAKPDLRFNDGRTDSAGNFWVGSVNMAKSATDAALYRLDSNGAATFIEGGMTTCNGAAFNADGTKFMHTDTPSHSLRCYDVVGNMLTNPQILNQFPYGKGRPDGGSFDADGYYWSALFDGGCVVRLSPSGEIVERVILPVTRPTMISFGGANYQTAFVTSARVGLSAADLEQQPLAGGLFSFQVPVPGLVEHDFH